MFTHSQVNVPVTNPHKKAIKNHAKRVQSRSVPVHVNDVDLVNVNVPHDVPSVKWCTKKDTTALKGKAIGVFFTTHANLYVNYNRMAMR
jgi:hypothetical protein